MFVSFKARQSTGSCMSEINETVKFIKSEERTPEQIEECIENAAEFIWRKYDKDMQIVKDAIRRRLQGK